jgi:cyclophilin family peptidyl-prolyl cis-trans isomerase/thiol-disulfide isomerase/thioredoxin
MIFTRLIFILFAFITQIAMITQVHAQQKSAKIVTAVEVIVETSKGSFTMQLNPEKAPKTVDNFLRYVDQGFYTNTLFHRVIPRFVVQGGGFEQGMKQRLNDGQVNNESDNGLKNIRGAISMARTNSPDSATSQFFINLTHNPSLDYKDRKPGYAVFGKVTEGMEVIDNIVKVPTITKGVYKDLPKQDVVILSAKRKGDSVASNIDPKTDNTQQTHTQFIAGEHYIVLDTPVATRDPGKIEVVEMFSYGCPHCYEFETLIQQWAKIQDSDVDYWDFPAVWNPPMKFFAKAFYAAHELNVADKIHLPLFSAIVIDQQNLSSEAKLGEFFARQGIDKKAFSKAFNLETVEDQAQQAELRVINYKPVGVPEIIVNGKYRIDRMRAGGYSEMLAVVDFLVNKERSLMK